MSKNTKTSFKKKTVWTVLVLCACVGFIFIAKACVGPRAELLIDKRITARSKGNPRADLWIVEYVDFQCATCRRASKILKDYIAQYPSRIYLQMRFHPLTKPHRYAMKSAIYAECAAEQNQFWPLHDQLFAEQEQWAASENPDVLFQEYAKTLGMNVGKLDACVQNPDSEQRVIKENDEALALGVTVTPTFFFNGRMVAGVKAIERELEVYFSETSPKGEAR